jgi:hypothetical protein
MINNGLNPEEIRLRNGAELLLVIKEVVIRFAKVTTISN